VTGGEVVLVVSPEFFQRRASHVQQFQLHLCGSHPIGKAFDDVLLARAGSLYHLVNSSVAFAGKKPLRKVVGERVQHLALLVEEEVFVLHLVQQHLWKRLIVVGHGFWGIG
jgi:hypothetical protein